MAAPDGYAPIRDYALIGNSKTAALVASSGSIDWFCFPRFDSPAVFCRLLDSRQGGYFRIAPAGAFASEREYVRGSAVLRTRFKTQRGIVELTDFMPLPAGAAGPSEILRRVEAVGGTAELSVELKPTFEYAAAKGQLELRPGGAIARSGAAQLTLWSAVPLQLGDGVARSSFQLEPHRPVWFGVREGGGAERLDPEEASRKLEATCGAWERWSSRCTYDGPYRKDVWRSALVLKLLTYDPSGALVAAPTASLPEELGGVRNWDYRYAWLRDSALILSALQSLGYTEEARGFFGWLQGQCMECLGDLQIMYAVDGDPELPEEVLGHLDGYRGSRPVRIGNAAASQQQLDIFGEVLDAAHLFRTRIGEADPMLPDVLWLMANRAAQRWREPDAGIWEVRGGRRHFLYSKLMCWVAVDRALKMRDIAKRGGDLALWERAAVEIREAILREGFDPKLGAFVQAFGESNLDASALVLPLVGFLPAADPRVVSTLERVRERLTAHGLVYRYLSPDGLAGGEGAFLMCTLWVVDNLAMAGRVDEAAALFEQVLGFANDVGLLSEEVNPTSRELLGNFPQGFTHLGVIRSALRIAEARGVRPGRGAGIRSPAR